jgi:MFS family permease
MADDTHLPPADDHGTSRLRPWSALAVIVAGQFMFVMDTFLVNLAVPAIRDEFQLGLGAASVVLAAGQLAYAGLVILGGGLGDLHGRGRVFVGGGVTFTAASIWCALAHSGPELILARLVLGAGSALMVPQVLATIPGLCPPLPHARAFAVFGTALGLGAAAGVLLGGWLLQADPFGVGWRGVFLVNVPLGAAVVVAAPALMPAAPPGRPTARLDLAGAAWLCAACAGLVGPLLAGSSLGWPGWLLAVALAGSVALAAAIRAGRVAARRGNVGLLHPDLLRDRGFRRGLAAAAGVQSANIAFYLTMSLFLQDSLALSPLASGSLLVPPALAFTVASLLGGGREGGSAIPVLLRGTALQGLGLLAVGTLATGWTHPALPGLALAMTVFGFGQGLVMAPLSGAVLRSVRPRLAGIGAGLLTTVQQAAGAAGIAVVAAVKGIGDFGVLPALAALGVSIALTAELLRRMRQAA